MKLMELMEARMVVVANVCEVGAVRGHTFAYALAGTEPRYTDPYRTPEEADRARRDLIEAMRWEPHPR